MVYTLILTPEHPVGELRWVMVTMGLVPIFEMTEVEVAFHLWHVMFWAEPIEPSPPKQ